MEVTQIIPLDDGYILAGYVCATEHPLLSKHANLWFEEAAVVPTPSIIAMTSTISG